MAASAGVCSGPRPCLHPNDRRCVDRQAFGRAPNMPYLPGGSACGARVGAYMRAESQPTDAADSLGIVTDALARTDETLELAARHLDPSLVEVLRILGFDGDHVTARGSYLYD